MDFLQVTAPFHELVLCGDNIYTWCYDAAGKLLCSNCPDEIVLGTAFVQFGGKGQMLDHVNDEDGKMPRIIGTALGMMWYAVYEYEVRELKRCWTLGPVFYKEISVDVVTRGFQWYAGQMELSQSWQQSLFEAVKAVPVASHILMARYALMLHYCLTGVRLKVSDICQGAMAQEITEKHPAKHDRHQVAMRERALLDMVRNGDLNYQDALSDSMNISYGVPVEGGDALRQAKTSVVVFASLVCRAAMDGGLSPETAYSLGDSYIQAAASAKTLDEVSALAPALYQDFIERVHKLRVAPSLSPQIRRCCDYIEMNIDKKLRAKDLAELVGYSEYYLTKRFHEELGVSFNDYVKAAKVERAKILLTSTEDTLAEIAAKLSFGTRSYFTKVFTEFAGMPPLAYRENH